MIGSSDPDFTASEDEVMGAATELFMYSRALQTERRGKPADDIITTLLSADVDGEKLDETEFDMFFLLLSVAGNETTRNSITWGMKAFFDFPDQWEKFKSDPGRYMDTTVEEIVRWATPVLHFRRQALQDYELGGVKINEGDKIIMWHIAANRDPRAFDDPWTFDIERSPNDHIGFGGGGPHFCLGANLARQEIRLMFDAIAKRLPDIHLDGDVRYLRSNFIGGIKQMRWPSPRRRRPTPRPWTASAPRRGRRAPPATAARSVAERADSRGAMSRATWTGSARAAWPMAVVLVLLAAAVAAIVVSVTVDDLVVWPAALPLFLSALVVSAFRSVTVTIDRTQLVARYAPPFAFGHRIARRDIESAEMIDVRPMKWGGWGYRGSRRLFKRAAIVIRGGPGLRLGLADGTILTITVDDPPGAIDALRR